MERRLHIIACAAALLSICFVGWLAVMAVSCFVLRSADGSRFQRLTIEYEEDDGTSDAPRLVESSDYGTDVAATDFGSDSASARAASAGSEVNNNASHTKEVTEGEQVATRNLSVAVLKVEPGPYDQHDKTPTVKVSVKMHNTSGHVIYVKPSNWDADTKDGRRVDHKKYIEDESGNRDTRSFSPTAISPGASLEGVLYFDGEELEAVLYEPHWLISREDDLVRFEVG